MARGGHNRIDLIGQRFGRLVVLSYSETAGRRARWRCACNCGNESIVSGKDLRSGHTQSCGCGERCKHGKYNNRFYCTYQGMMKRCYDEKHVAYVRYGGRGITVCDEWVRSIDAFIAWCESHGEIPLGDTLDRRDNDGNYTPDNCRFVSKKVQSANTRTNKNRRVLCAHVQ